MQKILIWISLMAFLVTGCTSAAEIQKIMRMRNDELKYEYDNKAAEKRGGTIEVRSFIVDDVLPPDTIVKVKNLVIPLIVIDYARHEYQCKLGYHEIVNDYKKFMRNSFIEDLIQNSVYAYVENQGALTVDIHIKKVDLSGTFTSWWGFSFLPFLLIGKDEGGAELVDVDIQAEAIMKKDQTVVFSGDVHGKHAVRARKIVASTEYTTMMIESLAAAVKNLNANVIQAINQQELNMESRASLHESTLAIDRIATSLSLNGDTYKDPVTDMEFIFVKGGCYRMGNKNADAEMSEKPTHKVCVDDFYMSKYEVTQTQWSVIMGDNPSKDKKGNAYPVNNVTWEDAHTYALKFKYKTGVTFRLPTEAEWEYAARSGGKDEKWPGTNHELELKDYAWYENLSIAGDRGVKSVGFKKPNGLGLYDMAGNVKEWVSDWWGSDYYISSPRDNPQGPATGMGKIIRGGSYDSFPSDTRTTRREARDNTEKYDDVGFRLVIQIRQGR